MTQTPTVPLVETWKKALEQSYNLVRTGIVLDRSRENMLLEYYHKLSAASFRIEVNRQAQAVGLPEAPDGAQYRYDLWDHEFVLVRSSL